MTTTTTIPEPAATDTREARGLALYRDRGHEIRRFGTGLYRVPSCSGEGFYTVDYLDEWCNCPDHSHHPEMSCKHILAVTIHHAKLQRSSRGPCAGCGHRFRHRELVEVLEEDHLTFFEGDQLCRTCADNAGVAY